MVASVTSVSAVAVALRPSWSRRAISPKESPGPNLRACPVTVLTVTVPSVMIMKPTPPSPRTTISCPAGCLTVFICFSMERTSWSGRPSKILASLISLTAGILCLLFLVEEFLVEAVGLLLAAVHDLRVALQGVQVGVAQDLLHKAHITPGDLEQRGCRGVARHVRRLERPRADLFADLLDDVARAGRGEPSLTVVTRGAVEVDEQRQAGIGASGQVVRHRRVRVLRQVHAALLGPLAGDDQAIAAAREISAVQRQRFGNAAAGADEELHQGAVALLEQGVAGQRVE